MPIQIVKGYISNAYINLPHPIFLITIIFPSNHRVLRCMRTLALLLIQIIFSPILYLEGSNIMVYNVTLIYIWAYKRKISLVFENKYISRTNLCFNFGRRVWISLNHQYEWIKMQLIIHRNKIISSTRIWLSTIYQIIFPCFCDILQLCVNNTILCYWKTNPILGKHLRRT